MAPDDPDLALVRALQAGDDQALNLLMDRHQKGLFRFVFTYIPDKSVAFDLTQEAFARAYLNIGNFRPTAKFATWLYRITLNLCRDYVRSRAYRNASHTISTDQPIEGSEERRQLASVQQAPDRQAQMREELRALERAISELPAELRDPLVMTTLEGRSHKETGELLGISPKAVEMKVYRARKLLSKIMQKMGF